MTWLGYMDIVLIVIAAPIMLLIGVPADGYLIAAGAWIALRAIGVAVEAYARTVPEFNRTIGVRLAYMLGRIFLLAIVVILVRKSDGENAGLACLAVMVFAFTVQLATSAVNRPTRSRTR